MMREEQYVVIVTDPATGQQHERSYHPSFGDALEIAKNVYLNSGWEAEVVFVIADVSPRERIIRGWTPLYGFQSREDIKVAV